MRILLTGAGGQLGRELTRRLDPKFKLHAFSRRELDITDARRIEAIFDAQSPDLVVNAAAWTAVDRAETEEAKAFAVNAEAPERIAQICSNRGSALIHISTDYVFDGRKETPYREDDPPCPANAYGRSKERGERAIRETLDRHLIIRTAWLFSSHGANFVKAMLRASAKREELLIVNDQIGNPTAAADLAWCIAELATKIGEESQSFAWGTYHCVNRGAASWRDFAEAIVERAAPALGRKPKIHGIPTAEYPTPAIRPRNSRLDCARLQQTFGIVMPLWRRSLRHVIDEILSMRQISQEG